MVYIDKKNFEILYPIDVEDYADKYLKLNVDDIAFECDDLIAPVISILNKLGYKTKFCCQGHISTYTITQKPGNKEKYLIEKDSDNDIWSYPYIMFEDSYIDIKKNIPDGWELFYAAKDWRISSKRDSEGKKMELKRKIPGVDCRMILRMNNPVNEFIDQFDAVPVVLNKNLDNDRYQYLKYSTFSIWIADQMRDLAIWASKLPDNN